MFSSAKQNAVERKPKLLAEAREPTTELMVHPGLSAVEFLTVLRSTLDSKPLR